MRWTDPVHVPRPLQRPLKLLGLLIVAAVLWIALYYGIAKRYTFLELDIGFVLCVLLVIVVLSGCRNLWTADASMRRPSITNSVPLLTNLMLVLAFNLLFYHLPTWYLAWIRRFLPAAPAEMRDSTHAVAIALLHAMFVLASVAMSLRFYSQYLWNKRPSALEGGLLVTYWTLPCAFLSPLNGLPVAPHQYLLRLLALGLWPQVALSFMGGVILGLLFLWSPKVSVVFGVIGGIGLAAADFFLVIFSAMCC